MSSSLYAWGLAAEDTWHSLRFAWPCLAGVAGCLTGSKPTASIQRCVLYFFLPFCLYTSLTLFPCSLVLSLSLSNNFISGNAAISERYCLQTTLKKCQRTLLLWSAPAFRHVCDPRCRASSWELTHEKAILQASPTQSSSATPSWKCNNS